MLSTLLLDARQQLLVSAQSSHALAQPYATELVPWGNAIALFSPEHLELEGLQDISPGPMGLLLGEQNSFAYSPDWSEQEELGILSHWLSPGFPQVGTVYDFWLSPDQQWLALVNRLEGLLEIRSFPTLALRAHATISTAPGGGTLTVCFDMARQRVIVSDQHSSKLWTLSWRDGRLSSFRPGVGVLGNLLLSATGDMLFALTLKPNYGLVSLRLSDWSRIQHLALKGESCRLLGQSPLDLMSLSPDGRYLLLLSAHDVTQAYSSHVQVIDTQRWKISKRLLLSPEEKPCALAWMVPNHWRNQIPEPVSEASFMSEPEMWQPPPQPEARQAMAFAHMATPVSESLPESEPSPMPPSPEEQVLPSVSLRAQIEAEDEAILALQEAYVLSQTDVPPSQCPACTQQWEGGWECGLCGFEIENARRRFQKRYASVAPTDYLPRQHVVLADPHGRLIELNLRKQVVWELRGDDLPWRHPVDIQPLPQQQFLIVDSEHNAIGVISREGQRLWQWQSARSVQHRLVHPVRAIAYYPHPERADLAYAVVDQGQNRIVMMSPDQQVLMEITQLNQPHDVQRTPLGHWLVADTGHKRVVEYSAQGQLFKVWGAELQLAEPVLARRLWNGHTLIVDAAHHHILELDDQGEICQFYAYYKSGMPLELRMQSPTQLLRLPNQDLLLYNATKALQIVPAQKKLLWFSELAALQTPGPVAEVALHPQAKEEPPLKKLEKPAEEVGPQRLSGKARLEALIQKRVPIPQQESFEHPELFVRGDVELSPLSPFLIDARHNGVIQINRQGKILWHYGYEMGQDLRKVQGFQALEKSLVLADTGHDVILETQLFDKDLRVRLGGPAHSPLRQPRAVFKQTNGLFMIADQGNKRLVELNVQDEITWEYAHEEQVQMPQSIEVLANGDVLYADASLNAVIQINRQGEIQWRYDQRRGSALFGPSFATRLSTGNTLIADTYHHRVLEVDSRYQTVWEYQGFGRSSRIDPSWAQRLPNGNTLIAFFNRRYWVEFNAEGQSIWSYTLGKDIFSPPVEGDEETRISQDIEPIQPFYNAAEKRMLNQARQKIQAVVELHIELMDNVQMKAVRAQLILQRLESFSTVFKTFPAPDDLLADRFGKALIVTCIADRGVQSQTLIETVLAIAEVTQVKGHLPQIDA